MEDIFINSGITSLLLGFVFQALEKTCLLVASRNDVISRACEEGVNIDLLNETDIAQKLTSARLAGDFPLVCVKGVVKTYDNGVARYWYCF